MGTRGASSGDRSGTEREAELDRRCGEGVRRAFGRSLGDFRIDGCLMPHGLRPAEKKLLEAAREGNICEINGGRPETAIFDNRLRAGFIRFLALGGDAEAVVHETGVIPGPQASSRTPR